MVKLQIEGQWNPRPTILIISHKPTTTHGVTIWRASALASGRGSALRLRFPATPCFGAFSERPGVSPPITIPAIPCFSAFGERQGVSPPIAIPCFGRVEIFARWEGRGKMRMSCVGSAFDRRADALPLAEGALGPPTKKGFPNFSGTLSLF